MTPWSSITTSGDPPLAQARAHWLLIGFDRPFVKAQAESRTHPFTFRASELVAADNAPTTQSTQPASLHSVFKRSSPIHGPNKLSRMVESISIRIVPQ